VRPGRSPLFDLSSDDGSRISPTTTRDCGHAKKGRSARPQTARLGSSRRRILPSLLCRRCVSRRGLRQYGWHDLLRQPSLATDSKRRRLVLVGVSVGSALLRSTPEFQRRTDVQPLPVQRRQLELRQWRRRVPRNRNLSGRPTAAGLRDLPSQPHVLLGVVSMSSRFPSRGRRIILAVLVVLVVGAGAGGAAYSLAPRAASGTTAAPASVGDLRADFTARVVALGQKDVAPAPGSAFNTLRASIDGRQWSFSSYRNAAGEQCMVEELPGGGRGYGCQDRAALFARGPLYATWGSRQDPQGAGDRSKWDAAWVEGFAVAPITSVRLVLANCAVIQLPLNADGAFFGLVGQAAMHGGSLPYMVQGLNRSGSLAATRRVDLGPLSAKTGNIGKSAPPEADAACR
jgi:hypothetical protein